MRQVSIALVWSAFLVAFLSDRGSAQAQAPGRVEGAWGEVAGGLQSRIVLDRTTFQAGERIDVRVEVKNVGDRPVAVTRLPSESGESLKVWPGEFEVIAPDGRTPPDIVPFFQTGFGFDMEEMKRRGPPPQPMLDPGRTLVFTAGLEDFYYMGKPGHYRVRWKGEPPALSARDEWEEEIHRMEWDPPKREPPKPTVPALPAAPAAEIEVQPGAPDPVGPLLDAMPPGWRLSIACSRAVPGVAFGPRDQVQPSGRKVGKGTRLSLTHCPLPGMNMNLAGFYIHIVAEPSEIDATSKQEPASYLGKGKFGHVYLSSGDDMKSSGARWTHVRYDVRAALPVTDPPPDKPSGADWGRMICAVLKDCFDARETCPAMSDLCGRSKISPPDEHSRADLFWDSNAVPTERLKVEFTRKNPGDPYYCVRLSVQPIYPLPQLRMGPADKSIRWDGKSTVRGYEVKRLGVYVVVTVDSDDDVFRKTMNDILDREVSRVLSDTAEPEAQAPDRDIEVATSPQSTPEAQFSAVRNLAISPYSEERADALAKVACEAKADETTRDYAAMGLGNFTAAMPQEIRLAILGRLRQSLATEAGDTPDGIVRTLLRWGDAVYVEEVLGTKLAGHSMEVEVLQALPGQKASERLWELYLASPKGRKSIEYNRRAEIGRALATRGDKRGIDILLTLLPAENAPSRQHRLNVFLFLVRTLGRDFAHGSAKGGADLEETAEQMAKWWDEHREKFDFGRGEEKRQ